MMSFVKLTALALAAQAYLAHAQNVTVPSTCTKGFEGGTDEVLVTLPYNYTAVMSIIGSYKNLTWSGNPDNTVTLNGTDNTVGTARTYNTAGAHVIETILTYSKPPAPGPYNEVHNTALLSIPSANNLSLYIWYDGTVVTSVCDNKAVQFNFTAHYCATNGTAGGMILHELHSNDAMTVGKFLGGQNFTSCAALNATGPAPASYSSTATAGAGAASSTGSAASSGAASSASGTASAASSGAASSASGTASGSSSSASASASSSSSTGSASRFVVGMATVVVAAFAVAVFAM